jgi:hypothetical protein
MAALPPVSYLVVGANLPRADTPSGATLRRASIVVLFITSTSGNDKRRRGAEPGVYGSVPTNVNSCGDRV